ncbi:hypothetical protein M422DRAFT_25016 [Sphaerobolus stellatus SS14]|nr:hypothetical protein M422DRAFT_25016 [Sphaerobolus stellatus SS14]
MSTTHAAIATTSLGVVDIIQLPTPEPGNDEVLVRVEYSSVIPFDTYISDKAYYVSSFPLTLGLNAAGTVAKVGPNVSGLKPGDRVATFARADEALGKSMQEFALLSKYSVAKVPDNVGLPEAATVPDNFITAYFTLFDSLRLPIPASLPSTNPPPEKETSFLIYGAGSTAGQFMIQILHLAGYKSIFATASPRHHEYLRSLGASDLFDYADHELSSKILSANKGKPIKYVVDCISAESTLKQIAPVVAERSLVGLLLPIKEGSSLTTSGEMWLVLPDEKNPFAKGVECIGVKTFTYQNNEFMKENLMPRIVPELLEKGLIKPNRVRLLEEGSLKERAEVALDLLRHNKISGEKVILKVSTL